MERRIGSTTVSVHQGDIMSTSGPAIAAATRSSLRVADDLGLTSIALPAFGTGVGGFPLEEA